jgi:anti-sigma regulatory factor (Ser/Thr protein kinase)
MPPFILVPLLPIIQSHPGCERKGKTNMLLRLRLKQDRPKEAPPVDSGLATLEMLANDHAGGFGLFIIHRTMDDVRYESDSVENKLTLMKRR